MVFVMLMVCRVRDRGLIVLVQTFLEWLVAKYGDEEGRRRFAEWLKIKES